MSVPVGIFGAQAQSLAEMFSVSPSFQAEVGASTPEEAMEHIHLVEAIKPQFQSTQIVVCDAAGIASDIWGYVGGRTAVIVEREVEEALRRDEEHVDGPNPEEAFILFNNWLGAVISEVMMESHGSGRLMVQSFERPEWPERCDIEEMKPDGSPADYIWVKIVFVWGPK